MKDANNHSGRPPHDGDAAPAFSCEGASVFLHLSVEGELDPLRGAMLSSHLDACPDCREHQQELLEEKRWLLENAIRAPRLRDGFAASVCARLAEESVTPEAMIPEAVTSESDATPDARGAEGAPVRSPESAPDGSTRARPVAEALPWLSAAAVAVFVACLGMLFDRSSTEPLATSGDASLESSLAEVTAPTAVNVANTFVRAPENVAFNVASRSSPVSAANVDASTPRVLRSGEFCSVNKPARTLARVSFHCAPIDPAHEIVPAPQLVAEKVTPSSALLDGVPRRVRTQRKPRAPSIQIVVQPTRVQVPAGGLDTETLQAGTLHAAALDASRLARRTLRHGRISPNESGTFGRVFVLTRRLASRQIDPASVASSDPCADDTNHDGELDYRDVTHMCQVLMQPDTAETAEGLLALGPVADRDIDCEEEEEEDCT